MTDNHDDEQLTHVGWWCWRGDNHGHLATTACRSDNVPIHVPAEWADDMRAVIQRIEDGDEDDAPAAAAGVAPATDQTETVHGCPPDGSGLTPCCGRTLFELPRTDRMATDPDLITCTNEAEHRARYAAAIREADGWVLDDGQHMLDAVMAVADAEQAELRRSLVQAQAEAHQYRTALQGVARREAADTPAVDQPPLRTAIAQALAREDAHNWGYDHGFVHVYGGDPETDGFVDAVLAVLPDNSRAAVEAEAAERIRRELVCCHIYDRVNDTRELTFEQALKSRDWHDLCYWGEAAARLAEQRPDGLRRMADEETPHAQG